jgi:hypothetical protein
MDTRIETLTRSYEADRTNSAVALRLESLLRQAGRVSDADKIVVPTPIKEGREALSYILSSNGKRPRRARFTVTHKPTEKRITFSAQRECLEVAGWAGMDKAEREAAVLAAETDARFWVISSMVGNDNVSSYSPFGVIYREGNTLAFRWASESTISKSDRCVQAFAKMWASFKNGVMPSELTFINEGKCGRCGRVLTVPESRSRGQGPVCHSRYGHNTIAVQPCRGNHG